jgi:hypothetical protein
VGAGSALRDAIGRLAAAVEQLRLVVEQLVRGGGAVSQAGAATSRIATNPVQQSAPAASLAAYGGGPATASTRTSVVPELAPGESERLTLARNQVTYRRITVNGGATGTTIEPPRASTGVTAEAYVLRDHMRGAHQTQVLEAVNGSITVAPGESVTFMVRVRGDQPGAGTVDFAGSRIGLSVASTPIDALPMMAWVNESNATARGASGADAASVLAHFGVAATGNSGAAVVSDSNRSPVQYFSAAYEAATRANPAETARRIVDAERRASSSNPGAAFWVQVSDEQDKNASQVTGTVAWIAELRRHLQAHGSNAKLFVAAQARDFNLSYASVIDGWATTQSAVSHVRDNAIADIRAAATSYGRRIELMEYPGNAFFDGGTPGGAAISTASAALDGASSWFIYSANNLDVLERGGGDEGRGDIGGLVAIDGGRVLPTIALIEAELGANLGAAARVFGASATSGASQVASIADSLDAYRHVGTTPDLRLWEQQIGALLR